MSYRQEVDIRPAFHHQKAEQKHILPEDLDCYLDIPEEADLGRLRRCTDIETTEGPFFLYPEYKPQFPESVIGAYATIYDEYNREFTPFVEQAREHETDYQYILQGEAGSAINYFAQIDTRGLSRQYLEAAAGMEVEDVVRDLKRRIYEYENSLAMYGLLSGLFANNGQESFFRKQFHASLDDLRSRYGKKIALLAVTEGKYEAMMTSEFGRDPRSRISDADVKQISGFDTFMGPEDFKEYVKANGETCDYLLYARTSDPVVNQKHPDLSIDHPLLSDPDYRRIIRAHVITPNVDNPDLAKDDPRRINDTKAYMHPMGMAYQIAEDSEIYSPAFTQYMKSGKPYAEFPDGSRLSEGLKAFLISHGIDPMRVEKGEVLLRAKPLRSYGCYGHFQFDLGNRKQRQEVRQQTERRGGYVLQPEMNVSEVINTDDGSRFAHIDRMFMSWTNGPRFLGGFGSLMPRGNVEDKNGRNHGSKYTKWFENVRCTPR